MEFILLVQLKLILWSFSFNFKRKFSKVVWERNKYNGKGGGKFFLKTFVSSWVGDHPQEDLAKFGYTYNRR
jgi:hypothetical protein